MDIFFPMLVLGLVTSLHCVSMCGPMVASYALKDADEGSVAQRVVPNLAYQGAKIASYMMVGLVLGTIGSVLDLDGVRPYVMLGAGVFMVVLGLGMTGKARWATRIQPRPPRFLVRAFSKARGKAAEDIAAGHASLATPITFGLLTGLMPCAPLIAAQLNAAASGSALDGAIGMMAFGLGTAPLMLGFGTASTLIPPPLKRRAMAVLAVVVIVFGAVYLNRAAMLLGLPVNGKAIVAAVTGGGAAAAPASYAVAEDGVVEVPLVIENVRFVPDRLSLPAGTPVRLVVERREANACSDQLAIPQLGVLAELAPDAVTVVEIPPAAEGSYTLTCGMGMMYGQIAVGAAGADAGAVADGSAGAASAGADAACACCAGVGGSEEVEGAAAPGDDGVQRIEVDAAAGFVPNVIVLQAGVPAEITFGQASGCMAQVVSADLGFFEDLQAGPRTVALPPLEPGTYGFSCGMEMVFGRIVVE